MFNLFKKSANVVEAVNKLNNVVKMPAKEVAEVSSDEEDAVDDTPEVAAKTVDVHVEPGGGKGWPSDVSSVYYHRQQGLICIGTDSGAVYVYGDGFQYMRPTTRDEGIKPARMIALDPDLLLVAFSDNSIDVLELPAMNLVGDLDRSWMGPKAGQITAIFVDEPSEKNYTYIGTSEGTLLVLDVTDSEVRVCDFSLNWKAIGVSSAMTISDIKISPKDEKYLAVSFRSAMAHAGAVVIYDLSKMKAHKVFETRAIECLAWNHLGEILYCGAKDGTLLTVSVDKTHPSSPWNAKTELADEDEVEDVNEEPVSIRKLIWMAPQPPSVEGCLFALLGCPGTDDDALKTVVVGLSPMGTHGDMETVFSMPSLPAEKVVDCALVPTYLKSQAELAQMQVDDEDGEDGEASAASNALRATITPAILVLTRRNYVDDEGDGESSTRHLKIVRCPAVDMANWAFEVGSIAEPRLAREVLPGASTVTVVTGFTAEQSILSLAAVLLRKGAESDGVIAAAQRAGNTYSSGAPPPPPPQQSGPKGRPNAGRRLSTRAFFDLQQADAEEENDWEMVLAVGVHPDSVGQRKARGQDVVVKGYENGTVVAWGVSLPETRGNIWLPLMSMRCGKSAVTCISHDETCGLMVAGDEQGMLVIWEVFEESSGMSASEVLRQEHSKATVLANSRAKENEAKRKAAQSSHGESDEDSDAERSSRVDHQTQTTEYQLYSMYNFDGVREVLRTKLHNHITSTLLIPQFTTVVVGTEDGTVYICTQYSSVLFTEIEHLERCGATGAVIGLSFGNFLIAERHNVPAIYVAFASGNVAVVQLSSLQMVAYGPCIDNKHAAMLAEKPTSGSNHELCITDGYHNIVRRPALKDMALAMAEDALSTSRSSTPSVDSMHLSAEQDKSPLRDINNGLRMGLKGFATMKEKIDKTAKETAQALNIPLPPGSSEPPPEPQRKRKKIPFRDIPRYLMMLVGKVFITYDLHRFIRVSTKACLVGHNGNALSIKVISQKPMILTKFLAYGSDGAESDDESEGNMLCAAAVNANGLMVLISTKQKALINHSQLVHEAEDESQVIDFGCILPNGNCYLVRTGGEMVHSATINLVGSSLQLPSPLPERASPGANPPKNGLMLLHGREGAIAAQRAAARKRRSSMLKLSSTPFDLAKIFSKSRDQRQKDELIGTGAGRDGSDTDEMPRDRGGSTASRGTNKAVAAKAGLQETRKAFEERGEKLNRAAIKGEEIKDSAQQFNKAAKEQKEQLKKKSTLWGLF